MDPLAIGVTVGGVVLAIAVNLYFFTPRRATVATAPPPATPPHGLEAAPAAVRPMEVPPEAGAAIAAPEAPPVAPEAQEVRIHVRDGYDPSVIEVRAGQPVRIIFHREEVEGCSDTVLMPEWGIVQRLPAYQDTVVEFTPTEPGQFEFTCGMRMLRGKVVVR